MKNKFLTLFSAALLISLVARPTVASDKNSVVDYARVTRVEPVYRYVTVREPHRQCEYVRPARERHHNHNRGHHNGRNNHGRRDNGQRRFISGESILHKKKDSTHQAGKHSTGRTTSNARNTRENRTSHINSVESLRRQQANHVNSVGSLRRHQNRNSRRDNNRHAGNHQNRLVEHCVNTTISRQERRHDGYNVTYRYRGNTFQTRTNQHPGDRIRVLVRVRPH